MGNESRAGAGCLACCSALLGVGSDGGGPVVTIQWLLVLVLVLVVGGWCCTAAAGSGTSVHPFRKKQQNEEGFFRVYEPCNRPAANSRIW